MHKNKVDLLRSFHASKNIDVSRLSLRLMSVFFAALLLFAIGGAAAGADCPAAAQSWLTNCGARLGPHADGYSAPLSNSNSGFTGRVTMTCRNGKWSQSGPSCNEAGPPDDAQCIGVSGLPSSVAQGDTFIAYVVMKNISTNTWVAGGATPYRLGSQNPQDNWDWGLQRVPLNADQAPGVSVTFPIRVTVPATLPVGARSFSWRMVRDGVAWFGGTCSGTINVTKPRPACPAAPQSWLTNCGAQLESQIDGYSAPLSNTNPGFTGGITMTCSNGTWSQSGPSCIPTGVPPTMITKPATSITSMTATLNGSRNPNGHGVSAFFRYRTTVAASCDDSDAWGTRVPASGGTVLSSKGSPANYSERITGLSPATRYWYCAIGSNAGGTRMGNPPRTFTTSAPIPPSAPTGFVAATGACSNNWLDLSWNGSAGATRYTVMEGPRTVYSGPGLTVADSGLLFGSTHNYTVIASNVAGNSTIAATSGTVANACVGVRLIICPASQNVAVGVDAIYKAYYRAEGGLDCSNAAALGTDITNTGIYPTFPWTSSVTNIQYSSQAAAAAATGSRCGNVNGYQAVEGFVPCMPFTAPSGGASYWSQTSPAGIATGGANGRYRGAMVGGPATITVTSGADSTGAPYAGAISAAAQITVTADAPPLPAPTGFIATAGACGNNWLNLSWNGSARATRYTVMEGARTVYSGPGLAVADTGLPLGSTHNYTVIASSIAENSTPAATSGTVANACASN